MRLITQTLMAAVMMLPFHRAVAQRASAPIAPMHAAVDPVVSKLAADQKIGKLKVRGSTTAAPRPTISKGYLEYISG